MEPTQHHDAAAYRAMVDLTLKLILAGSFGDEPTAQASALEPAIAGPLALKAALRDYNGGSHDGARDELVGQLTAEVHRIQHGRIASLAHPNIAGALRECSLRVQAQAKRSPRPPLSFQQPISVENPSVAPTDESGHVFGRVVTVLSAGNPHVLID